MIETDQQLSIKELKWIRDLKIYCAHNQFDYLIIGTDPLTAYIYTGGGFFVEKRQMPTSKKEACNATS